MLWVLCGVAAAGLALALLLGPGRGASAPAPASGGYEGALRPPGIPVRDFALRDQDGRPASLARLRGRPAILTFLYSTCRTECPLTAQQIRGALDDVGRDVPVLAVSVDPAGDTPARARRFLVEQRMNGRMRFLLGTRARLAPIWKAYGIQPQGRGYDHSAYVFVLDRSGRQCVSFPISKLTPEALAHDLRVVGERRGCLR